MFSRIFGLVLLLAVLVYYVPARPQSFVVSASTEILRIEMVDDGNVEWELPEIELCARIMDPTAPRRSELNWCSADRYSSMRLQDAVVQWRDGYTLTFRSFAADYIDVLVERREDALPVRISETVEITNGSLLRIPVDHPAGRALIPARGYVTIGDVPNRSDTLLLREGRYEIRQNLGVFHRQSHVVERGTLFPGDRISFAGQEAPLWAQVFGGGDPGPKDTDTVVARLFLTELSPQSRWFDIVATTEPAFSALRITRVGGQPTLIAVSWTQRLLADALPVAIATILGLMGSIIALSNAYTAKRGPEAK